MSLGVNDAIGIGACRAPMHCSHYGFQAALRIVLHRTRNKTNWCPKPKWIMPQPLNKLHRHLPKKLLICSAGLCRTSSRESHTYDVDASFASLHCTCMAQDALRNMPSAPQRHPAMSQTRTNEDFEDNAFDNDVPEDITYWWGTICTDNSDSGFFHIRPGYYQHNHPPTGNIFAHFYDSEEFEIAGLLF